MVSNCLNKNNVGRSCAMQAHESRKIGAVLLLVQSFGGCQIESEKFFIAGFLYSRSFFRSAVVICLGLVTRKVEW